MAGVDFAFARRVLIALAIALVSVVLLQQTLAPF